MSELHSRYDWINYWENNALVFRLLRKKSRDARVAKVKSGEAMYEMSDFYPDEDKYLERPDSFEVLCMQLADYDYRYTQELMNNEDILDLYRFMMNKLSYTYQ